LRLSQNIRQDLFHKSHDTIGFKSDETHRLIIHEPETSIQENISKLTIDQDEDKYEFVENKTFQVVH
jgi:hypothetical protein